MNATLGQFLMITFMPYVPLLAGAVGGLLLTLLIIITFARFFKE